MTDAPEEGPEENGDFGPFRLLDELGRGGQGTVWLAEESELRRKVALKLLRVGPEALSGDGMDRFRREAEAAARLDDPHICGLLGAGEVDGIPYLAFRYVEGTTLARAIDDWRVERSSNGSAPSSKGAIQRTVQLFEKIARALHKAHEHGLIHRDVKPGNVMLTPEGEPVLLDFGLARDELTDDQSLTVTGDLLGTPAYMSPEQLTAHRIPLDRRTDVYSLGVMLYEALTLERPFAAPTRAGLYQQILAGDPSSVSTGNRHVPRDLRVVVETAMERDRDRRYQTAFDLAEDLRRFREFEPIRARPIGKLLRLRRWAQRHPALAVTAVGVAVMLGIALGVLDKTRRDLRQTRSIALASAAAQVVERDPSLSLLLGREAARLDQNARTLSPLHRALGHHLERAILRHEKRIASADVASDGAVLTASLDGTAKLWNGDGTLLHTLPHDTSVTSCAFSSDGQWMATGDQDGHLRLWDRSGVELVDVRAHAGSISTLEFDPAGSSAVLSGSSDGFARLWDLDGEPLASFDQRVNLSVARFSPDGQYVLTASYANARGRSREGDPTIARVWRRSGALHTRLEGHTDVLFDARFSPDGEHLVTASVDRTARVWRLDGQPLFALPHPTRVESAVIGRLGGEARIVTGSIDGGLRIWDFKGRLRNSIQEHGSSIGSITISRDGSRLLTTSRDQTARLFDANGRRLVEFVGHAGGVERGWFTPDGKGVVTLAFTSAVRIWTLQVEAMPIVREHLGGVSSAVFSRQGGRILTASADCTLRLWGRGGQELRRYEGHDDWVNFASFSPDGTTVVSAGDDSTARVWRTSDAEPLLTLRAPAGRWIGAAKYSPDGEWIATTVSDGTVVLWDAETGERDSTLREETGLLLNGLDFSPTRPWLAAAYEDGVARIWDWETGTLKRELVGHETRLFDVAFSPDGRLLLTTSFDGSARIWDLETGGVTVCVGHQGQLMGCAFSPDGTKVATSSRDGTARIWDLDGRELAVLRGHTGTVWDVSFSADGRRLVTASFDSTVRTWLVEPKDLLEQVDEHLERLGRDFTPEELAQWGELLGR